VARGGVVAIQLENPRNSEEPGLLANEQIIADTEAIKIKSSYGQALDVMSFAPRSYNETAALKQQSRHVEAAYDASGDSLSGSSIELSVAEKHDRHNPRKRDQSEEEPLEYFHIATLAGALINQNGKTEARKKRYANEN
jgi:hypothetical protein